jgi:hypothetical protein
VTELDLKAIKARAEATTGDAWQYRFDGKAMLGVVFVGSVRVATVDERIGSTANGEFIAAARTDVLALLDLVVELQDEVTRTQKLIEQLGGQIQAGAEDYKAGLSAAAAELDDALHDLQLVVGADYTTVGSAVVELMRRYAEVTAERDVLADKVAGRDETIQQVRALHPRSIFEAWAGQHAGSHICEMCREPWPCETISAIDGDPADDGSQTDG